MAAVWHRASMSGPVTAEAFPGGNVKLPLHRRAWIRPNWIRAMSQRRGRVDDQSLNRRCGSFTGSSVPGRRRSVSITTVMRC
jgi:hypothetical protein